MAIMKSSVFITGSSGFIAGNLLQKLNLGEYEIICCLSRNKSKITTDLSEKDNFKFIRGSIYDADLYTPYLASCDTVVHFAAVTGKARPEEYFKVNTEGTEFLIKQCKQLGVQNFLYISSIAVKFSGISQYYYAQSKRQGEDAVRSSGLKYTIVRPSIVIGKESPILASLSKLAKAPITPIFGDGRVKIQPIYIDDLTDCLLSIINENIFLDEAFDLGGPESVTIENFLKKIHQIYYKKDPRTIHIPLRLFIPFLSFLEKYFLSILPFTVGQLSSFRYDGTVEKNRLLLKHLPQMKNVDKMLRIAIDVCRDLYYINSLRNECNVFCYYLINQRPNEYVLEKYQDGHRKSDINKNLESKHFDNLLIRIAKISPFFTKMVDVYTCRFFKSSLFRKKLVLLLAILESCAQAHHCLDFVDPFSKVVLIIRMSQKGLVFICTLLLSTIMFMPLHFLLSFKIKKIKNTDQIN